MRARSSTYSGYILRGKTPASGDSGCDPFPMRSGQVRCRPNTPFEDHPPGGPKRIKLSAALDHPLLSSGKYLGQTTEFQAGKKASRRDAEEAKPGKAAAAGRAQGKHASAAEALSSMHGPVRTVADSLESAEQVIAATRSWLERAVIGLQLCPFAAGPYLGDRVRYCVSEQRSSVGLLEELSHELQALHDADPVECETTLLIHPQVLTDFLDYNDFLDDCDAAVAELGFQGDLQVASFHPRYQFAGTSAEDITNYTNRSPYPMLHLLREASVARAVASFPGIDAIGTKNMEALRRLGHEGWRKLWIA